MFSTKNHTEINHVESQKQWMNWTTLFVIAVSFTHMFFSISAFSGTTLVFGLPVDQIAAALVTLAIDLSTWRVSEYLVYMRGKQRKASNWTYALFIFSVSISFILNLTYFSLHLPVALNTYVAYTFAIMLAAFIPSVIGIVPMIAANLENDIQALTVEAEELSQELVSDAQIKEDLIRKLIAQGMNNSQIYAVIKGNRNKAITLINTLRDEIKTAL